MKDERWKMKDERWKMKDERWKMKDERWKMKDERWKMKDERWKMKDERWKMIDGKASKTQLIPRNPKIKIPAKSNKTLINGKIENDENEKLRLLVYVWMHIKHYKNRYGER